MKRKPKKPYGSPSGSNTTLLAGIGLAGLAALNRPAVAATATETPAFKPPAPVDTPVTPSGLVVYHVAPTSPIEEQAPLIFDILNAPAGAQFYIVGMPLSDDGAVVQDVVLLGKSAKRVSTLTAAPEGPSEVLYSLVIRSSTGTVLYDGDVQIITAEIPAEP